MGEAESFALHEALRYMAKWEHIVYSFENIFRQNYLYKIKVFIVSLISVCLSGSLLLHRKL